MVRFNFKKVAASVAALSIVACMAAVPTSASDTAVELTIGKKELTVSEAKGATVDIPITINAPALTGFSIVIDVQDSAEGGRVTRDFAFDTEENGLLESAEIVQRSNSSASGASWAVASPKNLKESFAVVHVTLPDDIEVGEKFEIKYMEKGPSGLANVWSNDEESALYDVISDDGWIEIIADPVDTTTTPVATTTTEAPATTTTEAPADTTTVPAGTTTAATTADAGNASNTSASTAAGAGGTGTTTVASSTGSPQTGSSDVLPIAGAAAAVAVLGGVALVAKKKND